MNKGDENDLIMHWFTLMSSTRGTYKEPVLEPTAVRAVKQICRAFQQNTTVFILSLEVLENYIRAKNAAGIKIEDTLLSTVTACFICHKFEGAPDALKMHHLMELLLHFSGLHYSQEHILRMEADILSTLEVKFPLATVADDLDVIIQKYMRESRLRADIQPLCYKILELVYVERHKWFFQMKEMYSENSECLEIFRMLMSSKFYVPVSVFVTALQLCQYRNVVDVDRILGDVTKHTNIHSDHLGILVAKIIEIIT